MILDVRGAVAAMLVVVVVMFTATTMQPVRITAEQPSRMVGTTASEAPAKQPTPVAASSSVVECEQMLDSMDRVFDYQRDARQKLFANSRAPPDPSIFFDRYEPEAVCLTEERFGGEYRYGSLGDGPKFVCGIDTLNPKDCLVYNVSHSYSFGLQPCFCSCLSR